MLFPGNMKMKERTEGMIHETLKSGGGMTETTGHDQELIVAPMSARCGLGDIFLFHMYMVVSQI